MRVLIPVFFHAPMGGLHYHVLSTVEFLQKNQHDVTVVCKPGPFAEKVKKTGAQVAVTDYSTEDVRRLLADLVHQQFDLVYAHPFDSRQIGLAVAETQRIPFILVMHGMYDDDISYYVNQTSKVIAVSESIATFLNERCPEVEEKLTVLMNGVDERFIPSPLPAATERLRATFVSRFDADMVFPLDVLLDGVRDPKLKNVPIDWTFVGEGTQKEKYETRFEEAIEGTSQSITWSGWAEPDEVIEQMTKSDFVVAPSRVAIESLSLGRPTVAIGSKGYHGLVTEDTWREAEATNYGGIGERRASYKSGSLGEVLIRLQDEKFRQDLATFSASLSSRYRNEEIQSNLLQIMHELLQKNSVPEQQSYAAIRYEQLHLHRANQLLENKLKRREEKLKKYYRQEE